MRFYFFALSRMLMQTLLFCMMLCLLLVKQLSSHSYAQEQIDNAVGTVAVQSARIVGDKSTTRIIFEFDKKPDFHLFYMEKPNRLVFEVDNGNFLLDDNTKLDAVGLVVNARYGAITTTKSRMVFSLGGPAKISSQTLKAIEQNNLHRLVLELSSVKQEAYSKLVEQQTALLGSSGNAVVKGNRVRSTKKKEGVFTIVIDPGHGGIDGGAVGSKKTVEKHITLKIAKLVGTELEKVGPFKVAYTREKDVFVSLKQRRSFTKRQQADLLISLHADTLKQKYVRGATIYTLAKKASDSLAAEVAESENLSDIIAGLAAPEAKDEVTDILAELTLRETTRFSKAFSKALISKMKGKINLIKNPQRSASFVVLKNPDVPSVLVELGYLSNRKDEALLSSNKWQKIAANQIVATILSFFETRIKANAIK